MYDDIINEVCAGLVPANAIDLEFKEIKTLNAAIVKMSVGLAGERIGVVIGGNFYDTINKEWYRWYDRRDSMVVKFFCNIGFFRDSAVNCKHCGGENSRKHVLDSCPYYEELSKSGWDKIKKFVWRDDFEEKGLDDVLNTLYFAPSDDRKIRTAEASALKEIITGMFMSQKEELRVN